jgi:very-short-patch-repair endonuclease
MSAVDSPALDRVKQVFRFLKAFAERNVPLKRMLSDQLWSIALADFPQHPAISIGEVRLGQAASAGEPPVDDAAPLIRVRRPKLTRAPVPPAALLDWVQGGWEDPNGTIQVVRDRNVLRDREFVTIGFTDEPARVSTLNEWRAGWTRWADAERPARAAMRVFERLYELRGRIELESERVELLLGDGRLRWIGAEGSIDHPVLLQRVELDFDPSVPEFRINDADRDPELYGALLQGGQAISSELLNKLRLELEQGGYHPLAGAATSGYLRRLVQLLGPHGTFQEKDVAVQATADPLISRHPVLFLRTRLSGFPAAFDRVLEDLEDEPQLPASLARLVGITPPIDDRPAPVEVSPWAEPPDVLLSKPANPEQIAIARALDRHGAVLVQGPPGTGKSHTIANLIGHLVAHGKRVLVTSHTTKALKVLRDQVVPTLQPLCVAVLDQDAEARSQMEQAVRGILSRLTTSRESVLEREVADFSETRLALNTHIDGLTADLRSVREAEYVPILIGGESTAPSDAARWVREHEGGNEWISGPLEYSAPVPLDARELTELYATNTRISAAEEAEIAAELPDAGALPTGVQFRGLVADSNVQEPAELTPFWTNPPDEAALPSLNHFALLVSNASDALVGFEPWQRVLVAAGYVGGSERDIWLGLRDIVSSAVKRWEAARPVLLEYEVSISANLPASDMRTSANEIAAHLDGGGSLGGFGFLFKGKWKALIDSTRVNGQRPTTAAQFRAICTRIDLDQGRHALATRWGRQAEPVGLPPVSAMGQAPEPSLADYVAQFEGLLGWWSAQWTPVAAAAEDAGFRWGAFRDREVARSGPAAPFERDAAILADSLPRAVSARCAAARREAALTRLRTAEELIARFRGPVCNAVRDAIRARNPESYDVATEALRELAAKRDMWVQRNRLLERLAAPAPAWAAAIRDRAPGHETAAVPGDVEAAWRWRQFRQEIDRRAALDEITLTRQLQQRRGELREATAQLIDRRAWLGQLRRTDLRAQKALQGWADTQRRIGKGTGKRVPELKVAARKLLDDARDAVPVWIMPLARVAESFDARSSRFDVVILDEASQSDVTGLLTWYLGDRIAVVGDHEQVSPSAVGQLVEAAELLRKEHLPDVPNSHLYDGLTSVYDLARQSFGGTIALREHFRCVPDIIEFSNRLAYNGEIKPLRNPSTARRPHVVEYVVDGSIGLERSGKVNLGEARMIAALVQALTEAPECAGKTIGAITLLGDEQAGLIQDLTVGLVGAIELEARKFAAGNAAQFQGDERDIVFLSMVDVPGDSPLMMRQEPARKQRYNVAASRAKDQLWLVHSLDPNRDLKEGDLRRTLIEHVRDPGAKRMAIADAARRAESPFEVAVIERLVGAGYRVASQVWVGRSRLDLVVSDGVGEVAVECDGDRFHGTDKIPEDMVRQAILERAGWRFIRIRGTRFYRHPAETTEWLFSELTRFGIKAAGPDVVTGEPAASPDEFRERIVRRAHECMRDAGWLTAAGIQEGEEPSPPSSG